MKQEAVNVGIKQYFQNESSNVVSNNIALRNSTVENEKLNDPK